MASIGEYLIYDLWRVMRPLAYHGQGKSGPYFEGWYFKLISADGSRRLSIIPGIYKAHDKKDSHAFIQVMDGSDGSSHYLTYPDPEFKVLPGQMDITLAENHFKPDSISLDLQHDDLVLRGELQFSGLQVWPVRPLSPGIMGWYAWVPGMECYHGIVSMDHHIQGTLNLNGESINFTGGCGYTEKDWGRAMPRAWVWMQSNHFDIPGISFTFSIADIPWGRVNFSGFLCGFILDGNLHRFATYTGAKVSDFTVTSDYVRFTLQDRRKRLSVIAHRVQGASLQAPTTVHMDRRIMETLSAAIDIRFEQKMDRAWHTIYTGTGKYAGLEVVGDLSV